MFDPRIKTITPKGELLRNRDNPVYLADKTF
jgi:hypothetical protein